MQQPYLIIQTDIFISAVATISEAAVKLSSVDQSVVIKRSGPLPSRKGIKFKHKMTHTHTPFLRSQLSPRPAAFQSQVLIHKLPLHPGNDKCRAFYQT